MKRIVYPLMMLFLLASCSSDESVPTPQTDWTPHVSRSVTGGQDIRVVGRQNGTLQFDNILIPASEGGKAKWKGDIKPDADKVNGSDEFIAFAPSGSGLPSSVSHDGVTEYFVDHHNDRPDSFTMQPLMAQLKVHIWVEETDVHQPLNDSIYLYAKADIDFPGKQFKNLTDRKHINLGEFSQSETLEQDGHHFDKFSMVRSMVVLPQTIPADEEVLWFSIENAHYFFKPDKEIKLKPGFLTSLTLHVVYVDEEGDPIEPPTKKVIAIDQSTVTISPWEVGNTIDGEIFNPNDNQ